MNKKLMVDIAEIFVKGGNGGDGKVSFLRTLSRPRGGPDGGDGGNGGNVYFVGNNNMSTLMDFRSKPNYKGESGQPGGKTEKTGAKGEDLRIRVPLGTLVYQIDSDREILIGDITENDQELLVALGGRGGKGNTRFKSSVNQAPKKATPGTEGEEKNIKLEVKLIADVGLVGFPNAGKSTLINKLAGTAAKIGSYPFTTLSPNLGICTLKNGKTAIVADLPGLIEGASEGKGLGDEFLRHLERTRLIVHLIDPFEAGSNEGEEVSKRAFSSYTAIRKELEDYGGGLSIKKEIVCVNKMDYLEIKEGFERIKDEFSRNDVDIIGISALTGEGIDNLIGKITELLEKVPEKPIFEVKRPVKMYNIENLPNRRIVFRKTNKGR